ncbi:MAG: DNA (cytosine-5-)-methyltransferase, partial [Candidatus Absconditabacterales bacterium]|nr:DNA (cytosine-5-)-methyltransferase [Candidatus Absconditabacterales bacterium]
MVNNNIRIVDLFGGIGGFRKGAENFFSKKNIKVECLLYAEKDKFARKTYFANWPDNHRWIYDVTKINEKTFCKNDKIDLLFAGFPCQPFSLMGKGKGFQDERGELFFAIEKIINQNRPEFFLLENVARIETINKRKTFLKIKQILSEKLKYNLFIYKLNSYDYGVEQIRRRIYFLGIKKKITEKQKQKLVKNPVYKGTSPSLFLEETVEDKYYLSE